MTNTYDVIVIGAGPGGITAAIEAARAGFKTGLVEKSSPGGVCLQVGCIPSKTFLHAASLMTEIRNATAWGIRTSGLTFDFPELIQKKRNVISILEKGIRNQLEKEKVSLIQGAARFVSSGEIQAGKENLKARYFILATGSRPRELAGLRFDGKQIISSTQGLDPGNLPARLLIVGGGVIGAEFASMYDSFGSKVTIVEMLDRLIATEDPEISRRLEISFKKRGMEIYLSDAIASLEKGKALSVRLKSGAAFEADQILVSVGRTRNTEELNLEAAGVRLGSDGSVEVDEYLETTQPGIFAIGDLIRAPQLAHAASYEASVAVRNLKEKKEKIDLSLIPNAIYTRPEIASVGMTLEKAKAQGYSNAKEVKILAGVLGRSHTEGAEEGLAKMVFDSATRRILGAHLFGAHVTELISEITLAIQAKLTISDLAKVIHPHPTLSEMFQELAKQ